MVLDTSLLNTQQYKVRIKGKVEQSRERSSALPLHLGVVAIEKRAFWSPSTKGRQLYLLIIIIIIPWEFFPSVLVDGLSLEFEWQQVSSSILDTSQYSGKCQQCCSLDCLHSSCYFQALQSVYQFFGDCTKSTNPSWHNRYFHVRHFFQFSSKVVVLNLLFTFFQFYFVVSWNNKFHNSASSFHLVWGGEIVLRSVRLAEIRWSVCMSNSQKSLCVSLSWTDSWLCI